MSNAQKILCACYAAIAIAALYGTWSQNLHYFGAPSLQQNVAAFGTFALDTRVNPASRSITIDILLFLLAAAFWMVHEARRLGLRFVWVYVVLSFLTAISVTFPLFLIARELRLDRGTAAGHRPARGDLVGLGVLTAFTLALCWFVAAG